MNNKISIISDAYFALGKRPITTLSPQSSLDLGASNIYDRVIPAILSSERFPFSTTYAKLNKNALAPADNLYQNSFKFPNNMLSFIRFKESQTCFDYQIMGSDIWTNQGEAEIYYSYENPDVIFHPAFSLYLVYLLCAHLALPITQKIDIQQVWEKKSNTQYGIMSSVITNQEPSKEIAYEPFISAMRSG